MRNEVSANIEVTGFELFNNAADNNKQFIAAELQRLLVAGARVLEIGSGSGQHAVYFYQQLKEVTWCPTDREPYFESLVRNLASIDLPGGGRRIEAPLYLDIAHFDIEQRFDAVFCANVIHIMTAELMPALMAGVSRCLVPGGLFILYGPYKYDGAFTTESNARFDDWLKSRDPVSGIRDIEHVCELAQAQGLILIEDNPMPANNQLLVFRQGKEDI